MSIAPIREKIDALDNRLVELINQRLVLAAEIGRIKRLAGDAIYVPEREDAVLRRICALNPGPISSEALRAVYREIMSAALRLEKPLLIAYLGPESGGAHAAATGKFGSSVDYRAMGKVGDLFAAVEKGDADLAVIPIENDAEAGVSAVLDRFVESELKIVGQLPVHGKSGGPARFFVLARKPAGAVGGGKDVTSLLVPVEDKAFSHSGSLSQILKPFAERGINLLKIESRTSKKTSASHYFLIEVTGHYEDPAMKEVVAALKRLSPEVKWLGSYPAAT
jgi:chorismate mutase-like protein